MILSFHPCIEADRNIICAGRSPNAGDMEAIKAADAVILSQGCSRILHEIARDHCQNVFPNYDARFEYPGKIGQIELFQKTGALHPATETFRDVGTYTTRYGGRSPRTASDYPRVFKFCWGGEGESVHLIDSPAAFDAILQKAATYEHSGQSGFLLQQYIPSEGKTLRVVVVGGTMVSYWRIQREKDRFHSSLASGAVLDAYADPELRKAAEQAVAGFCRQTGINLAGFDLLFSSCSESAKKRELPLFLEINYFFGRKGLGGSEKFYVLLHAEVEKWLAGLGMSLKRL